MHLSRSIAVLALVTAAHSLGAQSVPDWQIGISAGAGPRTQQAGQVYYLDGRVITERVSAVIRLGEPGRVRPVLQAEYQPFGQGDDLLLCAPAPNGSCRRDFPVTSGFGAAAGLSTALGSRLSATALVGGNIGERVRPFTELEVGLRATKHLAVTGTTRYSTWSEPGVGRIWYAPVLFGFRLQN